MPFIIRFILLPLMSFKILASDAIPVIQVEDTINPGTADYIISQIASAESSKAQYLVLQIDTPGGLLTSTRQIIQSMLNSPIPIIVWIGPKGAQAGSAGALITYAADVATMASGTNIGAAHPVDGSGKSIDKTSNDKVTNDTAAFAESLAKAKGRNSEWVKESVFSSKSIPSTTAAASKVIDFIAEDLNDLEIKLRGYTLKTKKGTLSQLPQSSHTFTIVKPTVKQRVVSFFANPTIAYLILSLGGLCLWIELSHPGLILPGIMGAFCVLLSLVSFQLLPIRMGALGLILLGIMLLIAELYITSYGVLGIGGITAFLLGSLYLMDTHIPEFQLSISLIIPVTLCLGVSVLTLSYLILKSRRLRIMDSYKSLVGLPSQAHTEITQTSGNLFINGELWAARSVDGCPISKGTEVEIKDIRGLQLIVQKKEKS